VCDRVWGTDRWLPERWTVVSGHVQTACWSPCGSMLLFATSEEPLIYSLTFSKLETVFQGDNASRSALPVVDLTEVEVSEGERLVVFRICGESPCLAYHQKYVTINIAL